MGDYDFDDYIGQHVEWYMCRDERNKQLELEEAFAKDSTKELESQEVGQLIYFQLKELTGMFRCIATQLCIMNDRNN